MTGTVSARAAPLHGIRILDLSLLLPGPLCTQILADLGADVIKVEPPQGDYARHMPSDIYSVANRNKRSVVLNLKQDVHREAFLRLATTADVVIEGFRPGVVDRLGVGYKDVQKVAPVVVYCSISGYGQDGPLRSAPGHDGNYLAASGALSFSGHWLEPPRRSGLPVADLAGGTFAAVSILAALRRRDVTGEGACLDVSLTDAVLAFTSVRAGAKLAYTGSERRHLYPTNDLFVTSDGKIIAVGVVEDHFWAGLRAAAGPLAAELLDKAFDDEDGRRRHGDRLKRALDEVFACRTAKEWLAELERHDVPAHRVLTMAEAVAEPQVRSRSIVAERDGQRHVVFPVLDHGQPLGTLTSVAPALGAHTAQVLAESGFSAAEIAEITGTGKPAG